MNAEQLTVTLIHLSDPERAHHSQRFFKTGPGQYGEGDQFLGIRVPELRRTAKLFRDMPLSEVTKLLRSPYHECRLTALFIMVYRYSRGDTQTKNQLYDCYMSHTKFINNWDLVDSSAGSIVGAHLGSTYHKTLTRLATSDNLWERRIAMIACLNYIVQGDPKPALLVIEILKYDPHDLIQKAVGWMLREIGKRCSEDILVHWLTHKKQYTKLPRTTLRYAIEHFDDETRHRFLTGTI